MPRLPLSCLKWRQRSLATQCLSHGRQVCRRWPLSWGELSLSVRVESLERPGSGYWLNPPDSSETPAVNAGPNVRTHTHRHARMGRTHTLKASSTRTHACSHTGTQAHSHTLYIQRSVFPQACPSCVRPENSLPSFSFI